MKSEAWKAADAFLASYFEMESENEKWFSDLKTKLQQRHEIEEEPFKEIFQQSKVHI